MRRVVIFPEPGYEGDKFTAKCLNSWHVPNCLLVEKLKSAGFDVVVFPCDVSGDDIGIYFEHPLNPVPLTGKSLLVTLEPPVVRPDQWEKITRLPYTRILTFAKELADDKRFFYLHFPIVRYRGQLNGTKRDKWMCAISGNKGSKHPQELYTARKHAYMAFGKDMDLYGQGWHEAPPDFLSKVNYLGPVSDKIATLAQYKYALVFENQALEGYCTEKYWDAVQAGCEVLYRGWKPEGLTLGDVDEEAWSSRIVEHVRQLA